MLPTPTSIAQKLDESPLIVNDWRQWPNKLSVRLKGLAAALSFIATAFTAAIPAAGLIMIWPLRFVLLIGAFLFIAAALKELIVKPDGSSN